MSKLDNWSLGLSIIGCFSLVLMIIYILGFVNIFILLVWIVFGLCGLVGFILAIVSLVKGSNQKWKPILAIFIYILLDIIMLANYGVINQTYYYEKLGSIHPGYYYNPGHSYRTAMGFRLTLPKDTMHLIELGHIDYYSSSLEFSTKNGRVTIVCWNIDSNHSQPFIPIIYFPNRQGILWYKDNNDYKLNLTVVNNIRRFNYGDYNNYSTFEKNITIDNSSAIEFGDILKNRNVYLIFLMENKDQCIFYFDVSPVNQKDFDSSMNEVISSFQMKGESNWWDYKSI